MLNPDISKWDFPVQRAVQAWKVGPNPRTRNKLPLLKPPFPLYAGAFLPVAWCFFCEFPTEVVLGTDFLHPCLRRLEFCLDLGNFLRNLHLISLKSLINGYDLTEVLVNLQHLVCPWRFAVIPFLIPKLSGMFRRSASLAILHLKSFAAIPSVSLVQLGHTNRSFFLSHESQREIALI